ncbi:MAG: hypothetical protein GY725_02695 [bacterium]|nr:hypothetical protein [bacterium]
MNDPRLLEWLEATRSLLKQSVSPQKFDELAKRREELKRSLESEPPSAPVSAELAAELSASETDLSQRLVGLEESIRSRIDELHLIREANCGYRPTRANRPAFISRSV